MSAGGVPYDDVSSGDRRRPGVSTRVKYGSVPIVKKCLDHALALSTEIAGLGGRDHSYRYRSTDRMHP